MLKVTSDTCFLASLDEEERCGYLVSAEIKQLWKVELEILTHIDVICRKHNIKYWVDYGTMLGAVRHHGFIPWDDDLDLGMLRTDYERFKSVVMEELPDGYFFQSFETDPGYFIGNACVRKNGTTAIMRTFTASNGKMKYRFHQGISVDILIFDNVPDNDRELDSFSQNVFKARDFAAYLEFAKGVFRSKDWGLWQKDKNLFLSACVRVVTITILDFISGGKYSSNLIKKSCLIAEKFKLENTKRIAPLTTMPYGNKELKIDKSIFDEMIYVEFENIKVPIPKRFDERLQICYGEWKTPIKNVSQHKGMFFKIDMPYQFYFNKKVFSD